VRKKKKVRETQRKKVRDRNKVTSKISNVLMGFSKAI
jgi:hypothetical protein